MNLGIDLFLLGELVTYESATNFSILLTLLVTIAMVPCRFKEEDRLALINVV